MTKREPGFYIVRERDILVWEVAFWDGIVWYFCGCLVPVHEDYLAEIGSRVDVPADVKEEPSDG
jgi:hypothetical protein